VLAKDRAGPQAGGFWARTNRALGPPGVGLRGAGKCVSGRGLTKRSSPREGSRRYRRRAGVHDALCTLVLLKEAGEYQQLPRRSKCRRSAEDGPPFPSTWADATAAHRTIENGVGDGAPKAAEQKSLASRAPEQGSNQHTTVERLRAKKRAAIGRLAMAQRGLALRLPRTSGEAQQRGQKAD
jgi:hypothetical protein